MYLAVSYLNIKQTRIYILLYSFMGLVALLILQAEWIYFVAQPVEYNQKMLMHILDKLDFFFYFFLFFFFFK